MNSNSKKQIIKSIDMMKKAHAYLVDMISVCRIQDALLLLQQCQESAIIIGTEIEKSEGEGTNAVRLLEEYCELVYSFYKKISNGEFDIEKVFYEELTAILGVVEKNVSSIEERTEVVFLPYKASMWDSLESVWMAADADLEWDVYVIPVPYFTKNPDGTLKEIHYEGELFPDYVPITHYDDYKIEERQPDIIYIHNPYDEANYVTSIHPAYYSKRLKELTDCLVYVPYFVLEEVNIKNKVKVKGMEHFVTLPGVLHAHKVVVQSEMMRQVYIDVMCKWAGEETRFYWENKIMGIGSPKYDKVQTTKRENIIIPKEWEKVIMKENGQWKKIIFYNISVTALLNYEERLLDKMQKVFAFFEKNKEEFVLLWRPHPLIKATVESMRPQLWNKYENLLEAYLEAGFGIYDDTSDMDRAIALCDAYYGDASSIVSLCKRAQKPVMIQSFGKEEHNCVVIEDFCIKDRKVLFVARDMNLICELDLDRGITDILGNIPSERIMMQRAVSKIDIWKNEIIFVPLNSDKIMIYNTEKQEWSDIAVDAKCERLKFFQTILFEDVLFLFGSLYPSIIKLDLITKQLTYYEEMFNELPEDFVEKGKAFFRCDYATVGSKVYFATCCGNLVLEFDLRTTDYSWYSVGNTGNEYSGIAWDGEYFWLSPRENTPVVRWDGKSDVKEMKLPQGVEGTNGLFLGVAVYQGDIIFPAMTPRKTVIIHKKSESDIEVADTAYSCYKVLSDSHRVVQDEYGRMFIDENGIERCYNNCLSDEVLQEYFDENKEQILLELLEDGCIESSLFDLERFCQLIHMHLHKQNDIEVGNVGTEIWEQTKGMI